MLNPVTVPRLSDQFVSLTDQVLGNQDVDKLDNERLAFHCQMLTMLVGSLVERVNALERAYGRNSDPLI